MNCRIVRVPPKIKGGKNLVSTGNAKVFEFDNCEILLSYGTPVAVKLHVGFFAEGVTLERGTYRTEKRWSHTTTCHLGRWGVSRADEIPQFVLETISSTVSRNY